MNCVYDTEKQNYRVDNRLIHVQYIYNIHIYHVTNVSIHWYDFDINIRVLAIQTIQITAMHTAHISIRREKNIREKQMQNRETFD